MINIEMLSIRDIHPYEGNAKIHSDSDLEVICKSIRDFGFNDPIGIWSDKNIIVEGHGRYLAAKKLKMKKVPCIRLDWMTDEERKAYALVHNKSTELSTWDDAVLADEMNKLDVAWDEFGFVDEEQKPFAFSSSEIDVENFDEREFEYECPECGFRFNA